MLRFFRFFPLTAWMSFWTFTIIFLMKWQINYALFHFFSCFWLCFINLRRSLWSPIGIWAHELFFYIRFRCWGALRFYSYCYWSPFKAASFREPKFDFTLRLFIPNICSFSFAGLMASKRVIYYLSLPFHSSKQIQYFFCI